MGQDLTQLSVFAVVGERDTTAVENLPIFKRAFEKYDQVSDPRYGWYHT